MGSGYVFANDLEDFVHEEYGMHDCGCPPLVWSESPVLPQYGSWYGVVEGEGFVVCGPELSIGVGMSERKL